jgi:hypothetical protein
MSTNIFPYNRLGAIQIIHQVIKNKKNVTRGVEKETKSVMHYLNDL